MDPMIFMDVSPSRDRGPVVALQHVTAITNDNNGGVRIHLTSGDTISVRLMTVIDVLRRIDETSLKAAGL